MADGEDNYEIIQGKIMEGKRVIFIINKVS